MESNFDKLRELIEGLWNHGETAMDVIFGDICRLIWICSKHPEDSQALLERPTEEVKLVCDRWMKECPYSYVAGGLRMYSSQVRFALGMLEDEHWTERSAEYRITFFKELYMQTKARQWRFNQHTHVQELEQAVTAMPVFQSVEDVILLTTDNEGLLISLEEKMCRGQVTACVEGRIQHDYLKMVLGLSGCETLGEHDILMDIDEERPVKNALSICFLNGISVAQPISSVDSTSDRIRGMFSHIQHYFDRCFDLVNDGSILVALLPRSLATLDRFGGQRELIERKFEVVAFVDVKGAKGRPSPESFVLMAFKKKQIGSEFAKGREIFLDALCFHGDVIENLNEVLEKLNSYLAREL